MGKIGKIGLALGGLYLGAGGFTTAFGWGIAQLGLSSLMGSKRVQGQRLNDLGVMLSQEGAELPYVAGTARHGLQLVWSSGLIEQSTISREGGGGSGGPTVKVEEFDYSVSLFLVGGCMQIDRLKRLKLNNKVFYSYNDGDEQGFTLDESEDGHYWFGENKAGAKLRIYKGHLDQPVDSMIEAAKGVGNWTNYPGCWCVAIEDLPLSDYNNSVPNATGWPYNSARRVKDVIHQIGAWCGYEESDFDLSALGDELVSENDDEGFIISNRQSGAGALQELQTAHYFKLVPVDGVLRAVRDGGSPVVRIPYSHQRARVLNGSGDAGGASGGTSGGAPGDGESSFGTPVKIDDAQARPYIQEISFYDTARENGVGYRPYNIPTDGLEGSTTLDTLKKETQALNYSSGGSRMMKLAKVLALRRRIEATSYMPTLGFEYRWLAPGDVITLEAVQGEPLPNGTVSLANRRDVDVWLNTIRLGQFGTMNLIAPKSDALIYQIPAPPDTQGLPTPSAPIEDAVFFYSETNSVLDSQNAYLGLYVAYGRPFSARPEVPGLKVDGLRVPNPDAALDATFNRGWVRVPESTIGNVYGTLATYEGDLDEFDDDTELVVEFATGSDVQSRTDSELNAGKNALIVGKEVVQFGTADYLGLFEGRKRWKLTHLKRGRRGTGHWITHHSGGEQVCVIDHGCGFIAFDPARLNTEVDGIVNFYSTDDLELGILLHGYTFYPYPLVNVESSRNMDDDISVTFETQSRYNDNPGFVETVSSGQAKYEMDVLDSLGVVISTYESDSPSFTVPAADQITLFGTVQSSIDVVLYQNNSLVGRGYPTYITV